MIAKRFSPAEAKRVGLVTESAVDWSGVVDIDLGDETGSGAATDSGTEPVEASLAGIDIDLGLHTAEKQLNMRIILYDGIQKYFKGIDLRGAVQDNAAMKISFGVMFALSGFASF